jgi:hypothetical protein
MNDDQHLLASGYLDDALTSDERARAEADAEVMATVEGLREIRRALSVVEPPDPARRESAIDAALATFADELVVAPPNVKPLTSRGSRVWLAGAAAAALIIIVAGSILVARHGEGDEDTAGGAAGTTGTAQVLSRDGAETAGSTARAAAPNATGGVEDASGATTQPVQGQARTTASTAGGAAPAATALAPPVLTSSADLTAYAARPRSERKELAAGVARTCHGGRWLGPAMYVVDGVGTPVQVFLVVNAGVVRAVDSATCAVVATAPAP